ncbi:DUF5615 family PIN-like protein [Euzebya sp.]|uniref:DUF5615 family PIN-like protein n=1 Tax=Euzebya sp. TaxID=1971409 RepID=UPI00351436F8
MRLCLDHHFPVMLATRLVEDGFDVVTAHQRGWHTLHDEALLDHCTSEGRVLMTNNVRDFVVIAQGWAAGGRSHAGLIFTDDARWPRTADTTGRFVDALRPLLDLPDDHLRDQVHWL